MVTAVLLGWKKVVDPAAYLPWERL